MYMITRHGKKWTVTECLRLQREFELLKLNIRKISLLHQRSRRSIIFKLVKEGIVNYNDAWSSSTDDDRDRDRDRDRDSDRDRDRDRDRDDKK